ncbi:MAG TPA: PilZ domain-containing protein, partial [Candidatus Binatia bacterium]|nr:PilZ domain-containing protein [Candidatus Binatia bacterium]
MRFPIKLEAIVHAMEGDLQAVTINVSNTGVLFAVDQAVRVGQRLEFTLFLSIGPESERNGQIHCKGKIVRCEAKKWRFEAAATIEDYEFG